MVSAAPCCKAQRGVAAEPRAALINGGPVGEGNERDAEDVLTTVSSANLVR